MIPIFPKANITVAYIASGAPVQVQLSGVIRNADGDFPFRQAITQFTTDRTPQTLYTFRDLPAGEVIAFSVAGDYTGIERGQFYIIARIVNPGDGVNGGLIIAQGYAYNTHNVMLGENVEPGPGGGEGWHRVVTGADPAAGTNASDAVPTNAIWRLEAYQIALVTVAGSTAQPRLVAETPTRKRKWIGGAQDAHAGAETQTHVWTQGNGSAADAVPGVVADTETISLRTEVPDRLYLVEADIIRTVTAGTFQATDNYGAPDISVEEWLMI